MELKTWAPFVDLERDVRGMLDRYWPERQGGEVDLLRVPVDVRREGESLIITAELPGVDPVVDVDVSIDGDILVISGEKSHEEETRDGDRLLWERRYGRFERRLTLPDGVDPESIEATFDKGVLTVKVPTPAVEPPARRQIPVNLPKI